MYIVQDVLNNKVCGGGWLEWVLIFFFKQSATKNFLVHYEQLKYFSRSMKS